jgi:hypothetical protein
MITVTLNDEHVKINRDTCLTDAEMEEVLRWKNLMGFDDLTIKGHTIYADGATWKITEIQRNLDDHDAELMEADVRRQYDE